MRRLSRTLASLALLLGLAGLTPAQDATLPASTPYYPLDVGNTWHFKTGQNSYQLKVSKIEKVGSTPAARIDFIVNGKSIAHEHITVTKDAVLRVSVEGKEAKPPIKFLELPPKPGASWAVDAKVADLPLKGTFKLGEEEEVKVAAGTYKKVITVTGADMEANGVKLNVKYFFAENVGMIKQELNIGGQKVPMELEKFEPAGKK